MELSDTSKQLLCGVAVAGGALMAGAIGVNVATGVIELVTNGGNLAMAASKEREDRAQKLMDNVTRAVERSYQEAWKLGRARSAKADIDLAFENLDDALVRMKPTTQDIVSAGFNAQALYTSLKARLPDDSIFKSKDAADEVLRKIIINTYTLMRNDETFADDLMSLGIERLIGDMGQLGIKIDNLLDVVQRQHVEAILLAKRNQEELLQDNAQSRGIEPQHLRPLFDAADAALPEKDFEAAIEAAIKTLLARASDPVPVLNDPVEIASAIEAARKKLETLDTDGALHVLRKARADQAAIRQERARGEARLAKEEAAILRSIFDMDAAIVAYQEAAILDPSDPSPWFHIGDIRVSRGNLNAAMDDYEMGKSIAKKIGNERDLSVSHDLIGNIERARGNLEAALSAYQAALDITQTLAARDLANTEWQRDLSISYDRIGDVESARGKLEVALSTYQAGLAIRQMLATGDPANTQWQRDLSVSHNKIGDIERARGNLKAALSAYQADLKIAQTLAKRDPANTEWQRDLSISHDKIGNIERARGKLEAALSAYQAGLDIRQTLATRDPANTQWQRDLSVSHTKIGDIERARGRLEAALSAYQTGLDIDQTLAKRDPANTQWQRDLSVSYDRIGDIESARGKLEAALSAYQAGLDIDQTLAKRDPANTEWQRDMIVSQVKMAQMGDDPVGRYQAALEIAKDLEATGRLAPVDAWMVTDLRNRLAAAKDE